MRAPRSVGGHAASQERDVPENGAVVAREDAVVGEGRLDLERVAGPARKEKRNAGTGRSGRAVHENGRGEGRGEPSPDETRRREAKKRAVKRGTGKDSIQARHDSGPWQMRIFRQRPRDVRWKQEREGSSGTNPDTGVKREENAGRGRLKGRN